MTVEIIDPISVTLDENDILKRSFVRTGDLGDC